MIVGKSLMALSAAAVLGLSLSACGGGSGGHGSEQTAEIARAGRLSGEFASVQVSNDSIPEAGILLVLSGAGDSQEIVLDETRLFSFEAPPSGDLNLRIISPACTADFPIPDVVEGSELYIDLLWVDCDDGYVGVLYDFDESFEGIVRSTVVTGPSLIPVCVASGGEFVTRFIQDPTSFAHPAVTVAVGDRVAVQGHRDWWTKVSTEGVSLGEVQILDRGLADPCAGQSTSAVSPTEMRFRAAIEHAVSAIEEYGMDNESYVGVTPADVTSDAPSSLFDGSVINITATAESFEVCVTSVECGFCYISAHDFYSGGCG